MSNIDHDPRKYGSHTAAAVSRRIDTVLQAYRDGTLGTQNDSSLSPLYPRETVSPKILRELSRAASLREAGITEEHILDATFSVFDLLSHNEKDLATFLHGADLLDKNSYQPNPTRLFVDVILKTVAGFIEQLETSSKAAPILTKKYGLSTQRASQLRKELSNALDNLLETDVQDRTPENHYPPIAQIIMSIPEPFLRDMCANNIAKDILAKYPSRYNRAKMVENINSILEKKRLTTNTASLESLFLPDLQSENPIKLLYN